MQVAGSNGANPFAFTGGAALSAARPFGGAGAMTSRVAETDELPTVRVYPAVFDNPYQRLLYSAFSGVANLDLLRRPQLLRRWGFVRRADVVHFHWEDGTFWGVTSDRVVKRRLKSVMRMLHRHKASGGKLVWTVHNERPHRESELHEGFLTIREWLVKEADMIHVHSAAARDMLLDQWAPNPDRIEIVAHPSYQGIYADQAGIQAPKKAPEKARLLFFGSVNAYKGVDTLIDALGRDGVNGAVSHLTIAGSSVLARRRVIRDAMANVSFGTDLHLNRIPDDQVAALFQSAEFSVLPYRRSMTSGVAHLAMTFGLPVIAPRLGGMVEALPESCHTLLYDGDDPNGLPAAIARAAALTPTDYARLSADCFAVAADRAPENQSARLIQAMQARGIL